MHADRGVHGVYGIFPTDESYTYGFRVADVAIVIKTVTVDDPGNADDIRYGHGRVDYVYEIGKFEITAGQYAHFLNAVAATDTYGLADLVRVAKQRGVSVTFKTIESGAFGNSQRGKVEVSNEHATGQQAKTLAHELAHEALHWQERGPLTGTIAELEAESVAYVVCKHFGLDVEVRASRYIAIWQGDSKALRASLERIADTARGISDDIEAPQARKAVA